MHERVRIADEIDLTDEELVEMEHVMTWDEQPATTNTPRRIIAGIILSASLLASTIAVVGLREVQAQQEPTGTLTAPHAINGRIYAWPAIGTPAYSHSCEIVRFWEDFNAVAHCSEDGATYQYLPVGQPHQNTAGNPILAPGWYPVSTDR